MKSFYVATAAVVMALSVSSAHAGGFGQTNSNNAISSGGLLNVSPSIGLDLKLLNGVSVLNGNVVSGILSGNNTANGLLNGLTLGILGGNKSITNQSYSVKKGR